MVLRSRVIPKTPRRLETPFADQWPIKSAKDDVNIYESGEMGKLTLPYIVTPRSAASWIQKITRILISSLASSSSLLDL